MTLLLLGSGIFTTVLGVVHFFFPRLLDFETAIPLHGPPLKEFRLLSIRHPTSRKDVRKVVSLINGHVSFALTTIGLLDLSSGWWASDRFAPAVLIWIGAWWLLRTWYQATFERSSKSLALTALFLTLGLIHIAAAFRSMGP